MTASLLALAGCLGGAGGDGRDASTAPGAAPGARGLAAPGRNVPGRVAGACGEAQRTRTFVVLCPTYLPRAAPRWRRTDPHGFRLTATAARPASPGWYDIFFMYGGPSGEGRQTYAPDRFLHFEVAGGPLFARTFGVALAGDAATRVLGPRRVGERRGILLYQRPHPIGGQWGDHYVFSWREHGTRYFASLHAWRVRRAAVRTLDRIVAGLVPAGRAGAAPRRLQHAHLLD